MSKTAVHDNTHFSNIEKSIFTIIVDHAIAGMSLTDVNYTAAIDLLQRRFGDKERTIAAHMDTLMSLEPVVSEHHLIELRRLYDKTESSIRSLDALGVKPESYGTLLIPVFLKKLPSELRLILTRRVPTDEWQLTKIIETFLEELEARERANVHKHKSEFYPKRSRESPTIKTFSSTGNVGCCYCGLEGHAPTNCKTIVSIDERKRVIRSSGRCLFASAVVISVEIVTPPLDVLIAKGDIIQAFV